MLAIVVEGDCAYMANGPRAGKNTNHNARRLGWNERKHKNAVHRR